jgi:hypothetical protein
MDAAGFLIRAIGELDGFFLYHGITWVEAFSRSRKGARGLSVEGNYNWKEAYVFLQLSEGLLSRTTQLRMYSVGDGSSFWRHSIADDIIRPV